MQRLDLACRARLLHELKRRVRRLPHERDEVVPNLLCNVFRFFLDERGQGGVREHQLPISPQRAGRDAVALGDTLVVAREAPLDEDARDGLLRELLRGGSLVHSEPLSNHDLARAALAGLARLGRVVFAGFVLAHQGAVGAAVLGPTQGWIASLSAT